MGSDCVKAFVAKLRARNTPWGHDLYALIQAQMEAIRPTHLSLLDLQRIVADKILSYDMQKNSVEAVARNATIGKSTSKSSQIQNVGVNAIAQNPTMQESQSFGTIHKDRSRQRSESIDYSKPLGMLNRRQSTGSTYDQRSAWTSENVKRHEDAYSTRGRSPDRGRSCGRSTERYRTITRITKQMK
jgi:hypothetical protein